MGDVIELFKRDESLDSVLKSAAQLRQRKLYRIAQSGIVTRAQSIEKIFEQKMADHLLAQKKIEVEAFLCSSYVARVLSRFVILTPESYYATDYLIKRRSSQQAADMCFLICSLFPEWGNRKRRPMKLKGYEDLGMTLYYAYYRESHADIGKAMSARFVEMTEVAKSCAQGL